MSQIFTIENNKVVIEGLKTSSIENSNLITTNNLTVAENLIVNGTLTVDSLEVKNLKTESAVQSESIGRWAVNTEAELAGVGLSWSWGNGTTQLSYRDGGRIWTNGSFDVTSEGAYRVNGAPVLTGTELGPQITKSRLREVGPLKTLDVIGNSTISQFAFFNPNERRLGINTAQPNATLSVMDNDVETIIGTAGFSIASIGTYSNHSLAIVTDNTTRITVKNNGEVVFGDDRYKTAVVTINGTLNVNSIVSDTRIDRYSSLEFKATHDTSIYGQGLVWTGTGPKRQLVMLGGPDRLWTSESFDIGPDQSYYVNGAPVLSQNTLGSSVLHSSLRSVGILESLSVSGTTALLGPLNAKKVSSEVIELSSNNNQTAVVADGINSSNFISLIVSNDETYYADEHQVNIGNKNNSRRPVKLYGPVGVNVSNVDSDVDLTVKGHISFANKKFITGLSSPTEGTFNKGDICWNSNPQPDGYIGWVCIVSGGPGTWAPFGAIGRQ